jgi:hypothetical protein
MAWVLVAAVAWVVLAAALAVVIGRSIGLADQRAAVASWTDEVEQYLQKQAPAAP